MSHIFTVTTSRGAEEVLAAELRRMGLQRVKIDRGAVHFRGPLRDGYRACMWTRIGSRVLLRLERFQAHTAEEIHAGLRAIPWADHLSPTGGLWVDFVGTTRHIRNSQFGAQLTKDAIVDSLRTRAGERPVVDREHPDLRVHVHLRHSVVTVSVDLSGAALHWRTRDRHVGEAPLKENLAATLLHLADWPARAKRGEPLVDPMCGCGTLVLEAAGIAADRAPGLSRRRWGFSRWRSHQPADWLAVVEEAKQRWSDGEVPDNLRGMDIDPKVIAAARHNAFQLDLPVRFRRAALDQLRPLAGQPPGLLITNPPYGARMGAELDEALPALYQQLGDVLRQRMLGWTAFVFTSAGRLSKSVGLRTSQRLILHNGPLECRLLAFAISERAPEGSPQRG